MGVSVVFEGETVAPGIALRRARLAAGISQTRLSVDTDQQQATVSRWEHERHGIRLVNWLAAIEVCGYAVELDPGWPRTGISTQRFLNFLAECGYVVRVERKA